MSQAPRYITCAREDIRPIKIKNTLSFQTKDIPDEGPGLP